MRFDISLNELGALLKGKFVVSRSSAKKEFPVARDWVIILLTFAVLFIGTVGYASLILLSTDAISVPEALELKSPESVARQEITDVIEAYRAREAAYSLRGQAPTEIPDPSR